MNSMVIFEPHPANPVKTNICSSRPAGNFFIENDILYRPAQDCSKTYGGRIALNKITKLTTTEFEEETVGYINPVKNSFYNKGIHTISSAGNYTVIDAKRFTFVWAAFCYQLMRKVKKILRIDMLMINKVPGTFRSGLLGIILKFSCLAAIFLLFEGFGDKNQRKCSKQLPTSGCLLQN